MAQAECSEKSSSRLWERARQIVPKQLQAPEVGKRPIGAP